MALGMPRPTKHTKTGVYYVNVRVPADLVAQVGRTHKKKTLRTKDPQVAKERFPEVLATIQAEWQALRNGPAAIPHRQLVALAGEFYRDKMEALSDEPGEPSIWAAVSGLQDRLSGSPDSGIRTQKGKDARDARRRIDAAKNMAPTKNLRN